jgi:hypothetical protein
MSGPPCVSQNVSDDKANVAKAGGLFGEVASGSIEDLALVCRRKEEGNYDIEEGTQSEQVSLCRKTADGSMSLTLYACSCGPGWPHLNQRHSPT